MCQVSKLLSVFGGDGSTTTPDGERGEGFGEDKHSGDHNRPRGAWPQQEKNAVITGFEEGSNSMTLHAHLRAKKGQCLRPSCESLVLESQVETGALTR